MEVKLVGTTFGENFPEGNYPGGTCQHQKIIRR